MIIARDERLILLFIAHELFCDNCKLLHDELYNKNLFNCSMFLILVVGENSLESRQLGQWEGDKKSRMGGILGLLPPRENQSRGVFLLHRCFTGKCISSI